MKLVCLGQRDRRKSANAVRYMLNLRMCHFSGFQYCGWLDGLTCCYRGIYSLPLINTNVLSRAASTIKRPNGLAQVCVPTDGTTTEPLTPLSERDDDDGGHDNGGWFRPGALTELQLQTPSPSKGVARKLSRRGLSGAPGEGYLAIFQFPGGGLNLVFWSLQWPK